MFQQLEDLVRKYEDITRELSEPGVAADQNRFRTLMKTQSDLQELVTEYG
ncbi:MAG: peptide chain release factor 1, partial [Lachnospiraceae bacterium]|nr:peptide chain release factor 1 [Lachnospiraceae bacterium]